MKKIRSHVIKDQRGFTLVFLGLTIVVLLGFAALAVDIGYLYAARNELQNAADAAALAGARELGKIYLDKDTYTKNTTLGGDTYNIFLAAKEVAGKNAAAGESVSLKVFALKEDLNGKMVPDENNVSTVGADVILGNWDWSATSGDKLQTTGITQPDAVRVYAKRQKNVNPVTLFFANVLGIADAGVSAVATAALSGPSEIKEGGLPIPVGISKYWFEYYQESGFCSKQIQFHPTLNTNSGNKKEPAANISGCSGWHTYKDSPASASKLGTPASKPNDEILEMLKSGVYKSPLVTAGETELNFINGTLGSAFEDMDALFQAKKDPVTNVWNTTVVVYDSNDCSPSGAITIAGFARVEISEVAGPSEKTIYGIVDCNYVEPNVRGGGTSYGMKGSIPGLVQ